MEISASNATLAGALCHHTIERANQPPIYDQYGVTGVVVGYARGETCPPCQDACPPVPRLPLPELFTRNAKKAG